MAEDLILGESGTAGRLESVDVVDTLAGETAQAKKVLVHIGHGSRIGVDAGRAREDPGKPRAYGTSQTQADARLQHAVTFHDPSLGGIETRPVERVAQRGDEPARRLARQFGVGVQRDDVADRGDLVQVAADRRVTGIARPAQQAIEFAQLAALAFPPHPARSMTGFHWRRRWKRKNRS